MNSFGRIFRISIFGESHGGGLGVVVDGCPPGIELRKEDFAEDLARRSSTGRDGSTKRVEPDEVEILSGLFDNRATGAPIAFLFRNTNTRSQDYDQFRDRPRPGHADFTANYKYSGYNDNRGSGHFSGRVTLGLVVAGVIAKKILDPAKVEARLIEVGGESDIKAAIEKAVSADDSIGGLIEVRASGIPAGLGEPFFDAVESAISHIVFAVPAVRGIEFGSGFKAASMRGSEHNDAFVDKSGKTKTNNAGGINGGISNGNEILLRVAVKPTSSIFAPQESLDFKKNRMEKFEIEGRHDACIALRIPVVVEAAVAVALADLFLIDRLYERGKQ